MVAVHSRKAKFFFVRAVRAAGLLEFADNCKFVLNQVKAWPANRGFRRRHPDFATPPRHLAFDALNHFYWERYRDSGLQHASLFARLIQDHTPKGAPSFRQAFAISM